MEVDDVDDKIAVTAFMSGVRMHKFMLFLAKEPPKTMANLMVCAQKHMNAEDTMNARRERYGDNGSRLDKKRQHGSKEERD